MRVLQIQRRAAHWSLLATLLMCGVVACAAPAAPAPAPTAARAATSAAPAGAPASPAAPAPSAASTAPPVPLTFSYVPTIYVLPLLVAYERGYFQEFGIEPNIEPVTAGQDSIALLATGQIAGAYGGYSAGYLNAVKRGLEIRAVTSGAFVREGTRPLALMVRKALLDSGEVRGLSDLRGRRIIIFGGMGSTNAFYLGQILEAGGAGFGIRDVDMVNLPVPDAMQAMVNGAADAVHHAEPVVSTMIRENIAEQVGPSVKESAGGLMLGTQLLRERRELGARALAAILKAMRVDLQGSYWEKDDTLAVITRYTAMRPEMVRASDHYSFEPAPPSAAMLQQMERIFREVPGTLQYEGSITPDEVVDTGLMAEARRLAER
jgi:NitT/TauT family transport system substrate-binding protein